jgi:hypothetical protein
MQGGPPSGHQIQTILNKTYKILAIFNVPSNLMHYIWISLKTWSVYVYDNHNIITYITKYIINI